MSWLLAGAVCLALSAVLLYRMLPREGAPAMGGNAETAMALGQFFLMIFGIAMIIKGVV